MVGRKHVRRQTRQGPANHRPTMNRLACEHSVIDGSDLTNQPVTEPERELGQGSTLGTIAERQVNRGTLYPYQWEGCGEKVNEHHQSNH